jgi:hypothetical protein
MPDLANNVRFGVDGAHTKAEFLPERVIVNIAWHIEPPAVNAEFNPVLSHVK